MCGKVGRRQGLFGRPPQARRPSLFMLLLPDPLGTTASALSPSFHDSPLVPSGRGIPVGGRYEVRTRGEPFVRPPARRRRNCQGCGHDLRKIIPPGRADGGKGENEAFSLVAPPCDPVPTSPSVPKAKLLLEHEDTGRTGRRSTLKGKGDSGGGCKEGPRGGNRRFPTTGPSLAPPGGRRG